MRLKSLVGVAGFTALAVVSLSAPASALTRNCSYSTARLCIHYNSVGKGLNAEFGSDSSVSSFNPSVTSNDVYFKAGGQGSAGAGSWVWNNAAGFRNLSTVTKAAVFENSNYLGARDVFDIYTYGDLVKTKNNNASMTWGY